PVRAHEVPDPRVSEAQLLLDQALSEDVGEAASAVLLGDHEVRDAELRGGAEDIDRRFGVGLVDAAPGGPDRVRGEGPAQIEDVPLLIGQRPGGVAHVRAFRFDRVLVGSGCPCLRSATEHVLTRSRALGDVDEGGAVTTVGVVEGGEQFVRAVGVAVQGWGVGMRVGPAGPWGSWRALGSSPGPSAWLPWAPMASAGAGKSGPVSATPEGASPRWAISLRISPYPPLSTMMRISFTRAWTAAASSAIVNIAPPSPSTAITRASGAAIVAPMPAGRP